MLIGRGVPPILGVVAIALLVAAFIGGCGGEEASDSSTDEVAEQDVAEQDVAEQKTETAEEPVASVGDTVSIGNVQWTVTEVLRSDILVSRLGIEEGGDYVIVDVDFRNNSNQDVRLATPFVTLLDGQGREYEADIEFNFLHVYASENMFVDQVEPGGTKEGKVIFTVDDTNASGFKLQVGEAKFASNETASIDLGI
ncbi:MAG TPA: DUF4352 domain-containing protein [Rubrobacteraceae bacterium]|nr:DUF4352 domain-containing protein [Rubrobacteraceae bacterium]